ncbi:MAG: NfeD family protein [Anaerolineae bacterium]|nr:NfeD family protein [Anaerolineae bacterium]
MNTANLTVIEIIYWMSAAIGGTLFLLRTIMMFIGADFFHGDLETDFHGDFEADHDFDVDHDTDFSFKFLSLQGLTAFFMMFGLVGLSIFHTGLHPLFSILAGVVAGFFMVWVISMIFALVFRLQSEGTLQLANAVGAQGTVYLSIPPKGSGQVQIAVQGSLKILDAVSNSQKKIATGEQIRVVDISGNTLVVEIINK